MEERYDAVAIACSAGGLTALREVLGQLPASFEAPILVAFHRGDASTEYLLSLLRRSTKLEVRQAQEGEKPRAGVVYFAPGGRHLELNASGRLSVLRRGRIRFVCPSADLLFESVAAFHGARAVGVVLTGRGSDGAAGARAIRLAGGFVIAEDPRSSEYADMPVTAVETRKVDLTLPLPQIAFALDTLTRRAVAA